MSTKIIPKVTWYKNGKQLSEAYQQVGMQFAFVHRNSDGSLEVAHEWTKCRDFLNDAARTEASGEATHIYSFDFVKGENPQVDFDKIRVAVTSKALKKDGVAEFEEKMKYALSLLRHYEKCANVGLSRMKMLSPVGSGRAAVCLFLGPKMWMQSPFMISLYTLLIRLGDKKISFNTKEELDTKLKALVDDQEKGNIDDNDSIYLKGVWNKIRLILKNRSMLFPLKDGLHNIYFMKYNIRTYHGRSGIVSLTGCATPDSELNARMKTLNEKGAKTGND